MYPGEKNETFIQDVQFDVSGTKVWCVIPPSDKHSEHELKSLQVASTKILNLSLFPQKYVVVFGHAVKTVKIF